MPVRAFIADIGGYTEYMQSYRCMRGHAEAATRRLFDKIVDAAPRRVRM